MARVASLSNDAVAHEAAEDFLLGGGSAVGAVLCGFFASAGAVSGVLLGPVSLLVAGVGLGARAYDGRMLQPGQGAKRPRGFTEEEEIPEAARVAIPASVPALLTAHSYYGGQRLSTILKPGIALAKRAGATSRAEFLQQIRSVGGRAFAEREFVRALLRIAGPAQGGMISPVDLQPPERVDQTLDVSPGALLEPPWVDELPASDDVWGRGCAIGAVDVAGTFAVLAYRRVVDAMSVDEFELELPLAAVPVERGVTRIAPGTRLPVPTPIGIRCDDRGRPIELLAAPAASRLSAEDATLRIGRNADNREVRLAPRL